MHSLRRPHGEASERAVVHCGGLQRQEWVFQVKDRRIVLEYMLPPLTGLRRIIGCESNTSMTPGATVLVGRRPHYVHYRELVPVVTEEDGA